MFVPGLRLAPNAARPAYPESITLKFEGGTYVVPVLINGKITLEFTLDCGAAEVSIPADVFGTLQRAAAAALAHPDDASAEPLRGATARDRATGDVPPHGRVSRGAKPHGRVSRVVAKCVHGTRDCAHGLVVVALLLGSMTAQAWSDTSVAVIATDAGGDE
jgi:hypothetical protein